MPIDNVVIAGGGVAGWLAANMLARRFPSLSITVVDVERADDSLGIATGAETLLPPDLELLETAGFLEDDVIRAARGTFALGTALTGWRRDAPPSFLPFGSLGAPLGATAFHQLVTRRRAEDHAVNLANFSLAALCAQTGRFVRPLPGDQTVRSTLEFGIHLDVIEFREWLRIDATSRGAASLSSQIMGVATGNDGAAKGLLLEQGGHVEGDLFIDASGPARLLGGEIEDWRTWLPCDRAVSALRVTTDPPLPYAQVEAHHAGWQSFVPLQGAVDDLFVYSSSALPDGPAAAAFNSGRQHTPWRGNVVAIGGASAVIDPLAATQLHLALADIARLISLFPAERACRAEAAEYNRLALETTDCAFDFAVLRYKRNGRKGDPFWDDYRAMDVPDRLAHRIALYESCGRVALHDGETFEEAAWVAHFDALGIVPRRYDAIADTWPDARVEQHFAKIRDFMIQAVSTMPPHAAYLAQLMR